MADKLRAGSQFPPLVLRMLDGSSMTLPDDLESKYNLLLIYRGHW